MNSAPQFPQPFTPPVRIKVVSIVSSRYASEADKLVVSESQWHIPELKRPLNWDDRRQGIDVVLCESGTEVRLASSGMQSVPQPGWTILLTGGNQNDGYSWTLYGISQNLHN